MSARPSHGLLAACLCLVALAPASAREMKVLSEAQLHEALRGPWTLVRTPHFRVSSDHRLAMDSFQLTDLEASFERIADGLGLSESARDSIRREPIRFFYTRHRYLLDRLGGVGAEGVSFPEHGVIVSTRLPHGHEVAHLLIHVATRPRAAQTVPLLQEGLATYWGGTAGAAPRVHLERAREILAQRPVYLADFLQFPTFEGMDLEPTDRYAVAALFCAFYQERFSSSALLSLYRFLSAPAEELAMRPRDWVVLQFEGATGASFASLESEFHRWALRRPLGGIEYAIAPDEVPDGVVQSEDHWARWWATGDELVVEMGTTTDAPVDAELLWGERLRSPEKSALAQPAWRRWGLHVFPQGAELSDHRSRRRQAILDAKRLDAAGVPTSTAGHWILRLNIGMVDGLVAPGDADLFVTPRFDYGLSAQPLEPR